jgi:ABC-type uncharacterized transport system permease subunit
MMHRRKGAGTRDLILTNLVAILAGIVLSSFLLLFLDINPLTVYSAAMRSIFTDRYTAAEVFLKATPLIFTALAFAFTYKANLFNIGAQGQFYLGAVAAVSVSLLLDSKIPTILLLIIVLFASLLAGGILGAGIGFLKARYQANEFLTSMMSTYVALALMNYLLRTVLKETKGEYPQTDALSRQAWIPTIIKGTRFNWGFILAVVTAILIWVFLYKTPLGFRIRAIGSNARAVELAGINSKRIFVIAFLISGALAGAAGFTEVNGVQHMLIQDFNPEIGAAGLGIAILANANPIGIIFASVLFGAISVIGTLMGRMPGINVPPSIVSIIQGTVMIFVIAAYFVRSRIGIRRDKRKLKRGAA